MFLPNIIALLFIITCVYYVVAGTSVYNVDKNQRHRKRYLATKLFLASWALSHAMMTVSASDEVARIFWAAGFVSFSLFLPSWVDFLSLFTDFCAKPMRIFVNYLYLAFFTVAVLCITTTDVIMVPTALGYQFLFTNNLSLILTQILIAVSSVLIIYMQLRWVGASRTRWHRRQAITFAILTAAIAPPAIAVDLLVPIYFDFSVVAAASILILFITIPLNKVIREQRLLNITSSDIAEDIFSSVNQPILALDYFNHVALANCSAEMFWDFDLIGKNITELIKIDGKQPDDEFFDDDFSRDDGVTIDSNGTTRDCSILVTVIRDKNDDVLSKVVILNDITDLRVALHKANEASRAKTDFLARMSHEIRTPMNAVIGMTELALRENNIDRMKEHIYTVKQAGSTLLALINDILDFSKIEANKVDIMSDDYSLSALINDVVSLVRMRLANTGLQLVVKVDSNLPRTLYGDETRIRQAVLNVLSNALKYTEKGHVSLGVYMMPEQESAPESGTVNIVIEVKDTGRGIKPADIDELNRFAVFTQFDTERNKGIEGVGLGLAITKSIVDMMGGQIKVESEYGKGSTFRITLPQRVRTRVPLAIVKDPAKKSVLIYERRIVYIDSMAWSLSNLGIRHDFAESEADLFIKLQKETYRYLFVSYELYKKSKRILKKVSGNVTVVVLAEFGDVVSLENVQTMALPVYCASIADMLNGVSESQSQNNVEKEIPADFTAPTARVLVVDDVRTNLKVTEGVLKHYGIHVDLCDNGLAAIKAVSYAYQSGLSEQYDLIFMDHKMPGIDGIETTRRIRELAENESSQAADYYKNVPIIALTANAVVGMEEIFIENGFNGYLSKPINMVRLNVILEKWLPEEKIRH